MFFVAPLEAPVEVRGKAIGVPARVRAPLLSLSPMALLVILERFPKIANGRGETTRERKLAEFGAAVDLPPPGGLEIWTTAACPTVDVISWFVRHVAKRGSGSEQPCKTKEGDRFNGQNIYPRFGGPCWYSGWVYDPLLISLVPRRIKIYIRFGDRLFARTLAARRMWRST